jgi:hypothetical protein
MPSAKNVPGAMTVSNASGAAGKYSSRSME